jgi:hypothetical protein
MSYDAATAYIERYNDMVDRVNAVAARYANGPLRHWPTPRAI